ncbi:putative serine/threonine-protein kinase [Nannochloris sp. 'desiccata']|nr:hypothetical protein KSW81_000817 [Chlorella desiccata (nom. nud.)]KAH7620513.1 putative serine/threonine-protein kinase [Chlorella desiccata (nom. nud.)]
MMLRLIIIALCAHIGHCQLSQGSLERERDVQILLIFRNSIENWIEYQQANSIQGWTNNVPVCTWTGISCTDTGDIASLTLQCGACPLRARGLLVPDLARLSKLSTLNLEGQQFQGPLPQQWFEPDAWPQLINMFLSGNPIGGTLPASQPGSLRALTQLRINECGIAGPLPESWGTDETSMRRLSVLRASKNRFNGTLPQEWGTSAAFPELTTLDLSENQLSGVLPNLWSNPKAALLLQIIFLHGNQFTGGLPPGFGDPDALMSLRYLDLGGNPLGGEIPPEWGQPTSFPELRSLDLNDTGISGLIPRDIPRAYPQLQSLILAYNNLSGPIPPSLASATTLRRVVIKPGNDFLCGPVPENLPFQLCDDRDLTCLRLPVELLAECPAGLPIEPEIVPQAVSSPSSDPATGDDDAGSSSSSIGTDSGTAGDRSSDTQSNSSDGGGSNTGAIIGGVVGGVVGLLALLTAALFLVFRRPKRQSLFVSSSNPSFRSQKPSLRPFMSEEEEESAALDDGFGGPHGGRGSGGGGGGFPAGAAAGAGYNNGAYQHSQEQKHHQNSATVVPSNADVMSPMASMPLSTVLSSIKNSMMDRRSDSVMAAAASAGAAGGATTFGAGVVDKDDDSDRPGSSSGTAYDGDSVNPRSNLPESESFCPDQLPWDDWQVGLSELEVCHRPDGSEHIIGSGGFGKVYKALRNGVQPVAVKVIPTSSRGGDAERKEKDSTRQEIAILRACRDANIVQFQGAHLGPDQTLLVTEYMEGGDLMANIAAGRVTWWRRGRKIAIDVAKGLCFLHNRRIVHFDLKSPNILLTRDGTAKIADVGMAKFLNRDYVSAVVATLSWSAPEMLWGAKCTEKADIYSYGIVLWEICTGEIPERGRLRDIRVPEECPEEVRALVLECLETRPSMRPSALQIVERLQAVPKLSGPTAVVAGAAQADSDERTSSVETVEPSASQPEGSSGDAVTVVPAQASPEDGNADDTDHGDDGAGAIEVVVPS